MLKLTTRGKIDVNLFLFSQGLRPNSILLTLICDRWTIRKVIKFDRLFLLAMELYRQKYSNRNSYLYRVLRAVFYWYRPSVRTINILHSLIGFDRWLAEEVKLRMKFCDCKWRELTMCQGNVFEKATAFEKKWWETLEKLRYQQEAVIRICSLKAFP